MTGELSFTETDSAREVSVTSAELRALRRARHGLVVEEIEEGRARVGPRPGFAGTVLLPTGRRVVVQPKAPIASIPELLALAYRTLAPPASAGSASVEEATPTDWLLLQLAGEVRELLARGLRRGYVEQRELLSYVRGRMRPPINPSRLPLADCEYADFVLDTPENRLLRGVLELVAPAASTSFVRAELRDALAAFAEVQLIRPSVRAFDRVNVTRLNAHYQPSLRLARLALEGAGVEDAAGAITAPAHFVPMWQVWEAAVAASLTDAGVRELHAQPEFADRFEQIAGAPRLRITLRPDLLVGPRSAPRLAIELKWGPALVERYGRRRLRNQHLYQLAAYCTALDCDGWLLYPLIDQEMSSTYRFNDRTITIATVDLSVGQLGDLRRVSNEIGAITEPAITGGVAA